MLVLAGPFVEVAPGEDVPHLKSQAVVGLACERFEVLTCEVAVYVEVSPLGRLLEERVPVVSVMQTTELLVAAAVAPSVPLQLHGSAPRPSQKCIVQ